MFSHDLEAGSSRRTGPAPVATHASPAAKQAGPRPAKLMAGVYFLLAVVGGVGTWYYNLAYSTGPGGGNYLGDWFANAASSSAAVDIIVVLVVTSVFYVREGRRLGWRHPLALVFIPLNAVVAVAFAFPLFLGLRELSLQRKCR